MSLSGWLKAFRDLHERAKTGKLSPAEVKTYRSARDELARALLSAQRIALQPGKTPRQVLRVARALQADVEFHDGTERSTTRDVSAGGFGALLARPPKLDDEVKVSLRIPGGEALRCGAQVREVKLQAGNVYVCFAFIALPEAQVERLEMFVFDAVLAELGR